jgi:uncharacterized protein
LKIWIDLSNSPHPLLFAPIARRFEALGHEVGVTARDNAQTAELTLERWPTATIIGDQSPKSRTAKARLMGDRVRRLRHWAKHFDADVALSHNSYGQIVAARTLGLPVVTAMDYEGQPANHLGFRLAHKILLPEALRSSGVHRQGANSARVHFYAGFKEEIYLGDFENDQHVLASLGMASDRGPLVVARTPPSRAAYHRFGNALFEAATNALGHDPHARVVVLVRHPEQREAIQSLGLPNIVVPERAIDSRSLMYQADLVIGAGGTMTREAALMGVPTYSLFAGEQPAVDRALEGLGHLRRLSDVKEIVPVKPRPREPTPVAALQARAARLIDTFVATVIASVA